MYLASSVIRRVARSCPISPAACQVVPQVRLALQQQDVGDAEPGQVIGDRAADDAAADDDDVGAGGEHGVMLRLVRVDVRSTVHFCPCSTVGRKPDARRSTTPGPARRR